jgi:hypothetical protein
MRHDAPVRRGKTCPSKLRFFTEFLGNHYFSVQHRCSNPRLDYDQNTDPFVPPLLPIPIYTIL